MSESRFTRSSWVVLGICIVLLGIILALNVYRFGLPTDGWVYVEGNGFTENILGLPSALQPGDLPVSLDRLPFDGTQGTRPESWQAGGTVQYTIQRDGQNMTVAVPIENWNLPTLGRNILNDWRNYLIGLLYSLIGIFVFTRQPGNPAAQVLFLLGTVRLSMTIIFMVPDTLADYLDPFALNAVVILGYYIWGLLLFPTLFLLSLIFPKAKRPYRTYPVLTVFAIYLVEPLLIVIVGGPLADLGPTIGFGMVAVYGLLTVISVIHTLIVVRDDPVARAQIRWVGFGVALVAGYQFLSNVIGFFVSTPVVPGWLNVIDTLVYLTLPITIGIAILRYRLFDIDLIIRKTLQYALLTGLLALVYFGSVILLQSLTENLFGEQSPLVIVLSTLAIAALFNPLRTRIQDFIDRRFYRKKYDAEQALAQFAVMVRDEVDIQKLTTALLKVVEENLQPEKTNLWLKK
jgi:hypothetical protein